MCGSICCLPCCLAGRIPNQQKLSEPIPPGSQMAAFRASGHEIAKVHWVLKTGAMRKSIVVIVCVTVVAVVLWLTATIEFTSWDFRNNLWAPAHLLWRGESAYDIAGIFAGGNAIWFPQIVGVSSPLGLLPLQLATNLWLGTTVVLLVALTWHLSVQAAQSKPNPLAFGLLLMAVFLFPPTIRHLLLGQADVVLIAAMIAGTYALARNRLVVSALLFAVALSKPQLCTIVLPSLVAWLVIWQRQRWHALRFLVMTGGFALILTVPLWLGSTQWLDDFWSNLHRNPQWSQPVLYSQLYIKIGRPGLVLWGLAFAACLVLSVRLWHRLGPTRGVLWSMALTTLASPYLWSWDFVLLLPLFIDTAARLTNALSRVVLFASWAACLALTLVSNRASGAGDGRLWWLPLVIITGIALSLRLAERPGKRATAESSAS